MMNAADSTEPERDQPDGGQVHPPGQLVPAEQPQSEERGLKEERGQAFHGQRRAEDVTDQARVRRPVHAELELLDKSGHHADGHVDHQQRAEESGQPEIFRVLLAVISGMQQRGQEREPDGEGNEKKVVDRGKRELPPSQVGPHLIPSASSQPRSPRRVVVWVSPRAGWLASPVAGDYRDGVVGEAEGWPAVRSQVRNDDDHEQPGSPGACGHGLDPRRYLRDGIGRLLPGGTAGAPGDRRRLLDGHAPGDGRAVPHVRRRHRAT